jgi:hypothetical protein
MAKKQMAKREIGFSSGVQKERLVESIAGSLRVAGYAVTNKSVENVLQQHPLATRQELARELHGSLAENDGRDFTEELLAERREAVKREKP